MMPQQEASGSQQEQTGSSYGKYEGEPAYAYQQFDSSYQQPLREEQASKLYAPVPNNKNTLRLIAFGMTLLTLIALAVLCLMIVGGVGGWISFCAACLAIFIVAVVVIDKIE